LGLADCRDGDIRNTLKKLASEGQQIVVCDAINDGDLYALGAASENWPLITGGSGIAMGLPALHGFSAENAAPWRGISGPSLILSGSCSTATRNQIALHDEAGHTIFRVNAAEVIAGHVEAEAVVSDALAAGDMPLICTSESPEEVAAVQAQFGPLNAATAIEEFFSAAALAATDAGVTRLVVAGGETSGAVVSALSVKAMTIGPPVAPGVPIVKLLNRNIGMALKSGNFGQPKFFSKALSLLGGET
jgi:uncharacterized protein YgbK (DUF1537 family)